MSPPFIKSKSSQIKKTVSAFGIGQSLYSLYRSIVGPVSYGSGGDRTYSLIVFDRIVKTTSVYISATNEYREGCISQKVWLNRLDTYQFYAATGVAKLLQPSLNVAHCSENYDNPIMAITSISRYVDLPIKAKLYNETVVLVGEN
jgi:ACT domain-containing protein